MKAKNLGIFSALFVSICCVGPLLLILLGLGTLGIGAVIGKYHWHFLGVGVLLIIVAWSYYFKEKRTCDLKACQMENKRITSITLIIATLIVAIFVALNLYTYAVQKDYVEEKSQRPSAETKTVNIPVEGMTCFACEASVSTALKRIDGVINAKASAKERIASVSYDPDKTDLKRLIEAINKTGYKATLPERGKK